ncbi:hypothetical protein ACOMHN_053308 [Nucella lapillus]
MIKLILAVIVLLQPVMGIQYDEFTKFDFDFTDPHKRVDPQFVDPHKLFPSHKPFPHFGKKTFVPHKSVDPQFVDPHKTVDPHFVDLHKPFPKKPFFTKKTPISFPFDFKALQKLVNQIENNQAKILGNLDVIIQRKREFNGGLKALLEEQSAALSSLAAVAGDTEVARNNSAALLDGLGRILEGQAEIAQAISGEGDATRREVQRTGDFLERQLDKVIDKQKVILRSLARTEAVLDAGFAKDLSNEEVTQGLIGQARTAVKVTAVANAQGQANITAEVKRSQNAIQKDVANVFKRQGTILDRIDSLTNSEEKKLDRVLARQSDILAQVKTSQKAVQSDNQEANANEKQTQSLVRTAQTTIVKDLKNHQANQGQTQHLAKKCVAAATCELSEVDHALATLSSVAAAMEKTLLKGLVQVRQQQSQTQGLVTRAETNIVRNINNDFDQIDQVIKTIEKFVVAAKSKIKKHIQILEQNVKSTKASQSVSLKLLAKMAEVIHRLVKH